MYENYKFKVDSMAHDAGYIRKKVESHYRNVIILWCLCKYLEDYNDIHGLQHHEKGKLRTSMNEIAKLKAKNKDEVEIKRKALEDIFYDGDDYGTNYMSVISLFSKKFMKERITKGDTHVHVAQALCNESKKLIELMSSGTYLQITDYLNKVFPKGGNI